MASQQRMTPQQCRFFVQLLIDEAAKGSGQLRTQQFDVIASKINAQFKTHYDGKWLVGKRTREFRGWKIYRVLREQYTGVGVDPETGAIEASEEQWQAWEKTLGECRRFQNGGLVCYDLWSQYFLQSSATGDFATNPKTMPDNSDEERVIERSFRQVSRPVRTEGDMGNLASQAYEVGGSSRKSGKRVTFECNYSSGPTSKRSRSEKIEAAIEDWADQRMSSGGGDRDAGATIEVCMDILIAMNVEGELFAKGVKYIEDPCRRRIWMACGSNDQRRWILESL